LGAQALDQPDGSLVAPLVAKVYRLEFSACPTHRFPLAFSWEEFSMQLCITTWVKRSNGQTT
jgi:hypothetical protein